MDGPRGFMGPIPGGVNRRTEVAPLVAGRRISRQFTRGHTGGHSNPVLTKHWRKENPMDLTALLIRLVTGGVGGNIAGALLKGKSLGTLWNTVVGLLGGGLGGTALDAVGLLQNAGMVGDIGASTVGGGVLLWIVSLFKKKA